MNNIYKIIPYLNSVLLFLVPIYLYKNDISSDLIYKLIFIYTGSLAILIGANSKKYGKYADKLLIPILYFNIIWCIYFSYLYTTGLAQLIGIASSSLLMFNIYKSGMRFQGGRLANPNTIITSGLTPLLGLWFISQTGTHDGVLLMLVILLIPLFFDLKYYFDFRAYLLLAASIFYM